MRNTETGEFELVVGNRQLLSAFFILILLLAVTFAMGYVVGQNTPHGAKLQSSASSQLPGALNAAGDRPQPSSPAAPPPAPTAAGSAGPSSDPSNASGTASAAPPQGAQPPATGPAAGAAAVPAAPAAAPNGPVTELAPGSYWQVMAVHQADAEVLVRTIKETLGLPALMSPAPNNLMRVLVGPYNDTETMGRVKSQLEKAGFNPIRNNFK